MQQPLSMDTSPDNSNSMVVVSLRTRGIPSFSLSRLWTWRTHLLDLLNETSDITAAALITVTNLSWSAWLSIAITILVMSVNISKASTEPDVTSYFPLFAYIVLPLLMLIYLVIQRRDRAQTALNKFKVAYTSLALQTAAVSAATATAAPSAHVMPNHAPNPLSTYACASAPGHAPGILGNTGRQGDTTAMGTGLTRALTVVPTPAIQQAADNMQRVLQLLVQDLHRYLSHRRPYARHFYVPYRPERFKSDPLYQTSRELGVRARCLQHTVREVIVCSGCLRDALLVPDTAAHALWPQFGSGQVLPPGPGPGHGAAHTIMPTPTSTANVQAAMPACLQLSSQAVELHSAVEELMMLKELHTPVLIRASVRWFSTIIFPVFLGWYWLAASRGVAKAVGGIMAVVCQIGLMVLVDTAVGLEDPFDEAALDAVSCLESLDAAILMGSDNLAEGEVLARTLHQQPTSSIKVAGAAPNAAAAASNELWDGGTAAGPAGSIPAAMPPMPPPPAPV